MPDKRTRKKYIILLVSLFVVAGVYFLYRLKKDAFLDHQLQNMVHEKTNRLYSVRYNSISVDEVGGNVYIKNLYLKADTIRQLEMISAGDTNAAKMLLDVYIPEVKVVHFKTASALLSKDLVCSQIVITGPQVNILLFPGLNNEPIPNNRQYRYTSKFLAISTLSKPTVFPSTTAKW